MPRRAEAFVDVIHKVVFGRFFCRRIAEANWKILKLPRHFIANLAPEFRRLSYWSANLFFQQIRIN